MSIVVLQPYSAGLLAGDPNEILLGSGPHTGLSGPAGVDAVIEYNGMYINQRKNIDAVLVNSIDGLGDADIRDQREVNPAQHGETALDAFYGGRTLVLGGKLRAHTLAKMRDMQMGLRQMFADLTTERSLIFHTQDSTLDMFINCKKNQPIVMAEVQQNTQFERDFQVSLRASNPRFLNSILRSKSSVAYNDVLTILNNGNFNAQPIYTINGAITNPQVTLNVNGVNAGTLIIDGTIADGTSLVIDTSQRTVLDQAGNNKYSMLDPASAMPELPPGNTTVQLTGSAPGANAKLTVQWRYTYI